MQINIKFILQRMIRDHTYMPSAQVGVGGFNRNMCGDDIKKGKRGKYAGNGEGIGSENGRYFVVLAQLNT